MCGRYSIALRPSQVRAYLENEHMPVSDAPADEADNAPRQSYNFAPGYNGLVYRADVPDWGAGPRPEQQTHDDEGVPQHEPAQKDAGTEEEAGTDKEEQEAHYKLQTMKWGLIPFWTKRSPDYGSMLKTINCRGESLASNRGMWNTMKQRKRCVVVAQGFYEWLKKGKEKIPHYIKRPDGQLLCMAGLWDCVKYEGSDEKLYTYTIITTDSNKQVGFLHDRMPVLLDNASEEMWMWLDPKRYSWSKELQSVLKPYQGELECYPVPREVGKVGNDSPTFIIPISSTEAKGNIANFFASGKKATDSKGQPSGKEELRKKEEQDAKPEPAHKPAKEEEDVKPEPKEKAAEEQQDIKPEEEKPIKTETHVPKPDEEPHNLRTTDHTTSESNAPLPLPESPETAHGIKRGHVDDLSPSAPSPPPSKAAKTSQSQQEPKGVGRRGRATGRKTRSATSNDRGVAGQKKTRAKGKKEEKGSQKITGFFGGKN